MENTNKNFEIVKKSIEKILYEGGKNNILRIEMPNDYYIQMVCDYDSNEILIEAVSNNYLDKVNKLNNSKIDSLIDIGWESPVEDNENFKIDIIVKDENDLNSIVEIIFKTAREVYDCNEITQNMIDIELDN